MVECSMEQGWVYVLVNSSVPGLVKVGRTTKPVAERAAELSAATGVATPFLVAFDQAFTDCATAERAIHAELDRRGLRLAPNREFFRGPASDIIRIILQAAEGTPAEAPVTPDLSANALLQAGDRFLLGLGDTLQDTGEALRHFRLAASRGCLAAYERVGRIYTGIYLQRRDRASRRRAMIPLKQGALLGNYYCYSRMGVIFAADRHGVNFAKAWNLFFARREEAYLAELETDASFFIRTCCTYIRSCLLQRLPPGHLPLLMSMAEPIVATVLRDLDNTRAGSAERREIAAALRWSYETLLPAPTAKPLRPARVRADPVWAPEPESAAA
jgi:hypothetical protein